MAVITVSGIGYRQVYAVMGRGNLRKFANVWCLLVISLIGLRCVDCVYRVRADKTGINFVLLVLFGK